MSIFKLYILKADIDIVAGGCERAVQNIGCRKMPETTRLSLAEV